MPRGQYKRNKETAPAPAPINPAWVTTQPTGLIKFDVDVETVSGSPLIQLQGIIAQTKSEAINRAKQQLVFTAERSK